MNGISRDERTWAMICHVSALIGYVFPLAHILAPAFIWLVKRETSAFVDAQGKEAVNFQLSITIYLCVALLINFLLVGFGWTKGRMVVVPMMQMTLFGLPLFGAILLLAFSMIIVAMLKANDGQSFRYPLSIRFIK